MHVESGACDWSLTNKSSCQLRNASALLTAVKVVVEHVHSQNFVFPRAPGIVKQLV